MAAPATEADTSPENATEAEESVPMVVLFKVDGVEYTTPEEPNAALLLKFMWQKKADEFSAIVNLFEGLLGPDQCEKLMTETERLSSDQFQALLNAATMHLAGGNEGPKGQGNRSTGGRG
jgi:hypothetical protein